jgi:hypothetical protein
VVSTARRTVLLLAWVAAAAVAAMAMAAVASADPPPQANASCFGQSESADQRATGPGEEISGVATTLADARATPVAAQLVPFLQEATHAACQGQQP